MCIVLAAAIAGFCCPYAALLPGGGWTPWFYQDFEGQAATSDGLDPGGTGAATPPSGGLPAGDDGGGFANRIKPGGPAMIALMFPAGKDRIYGLYGFTLETCDPCPHMPYSMWCTSDVAERDAFCRKVWPAGLFFTAGSFLATLTGSIGACVQGCCGGPQASQPRRGAITSSVLLTLASIVMALWVVMIGTARNDLSSAGGGGAVSLQAGFWLAVGGLAAVVLAAVLACIGTCRLRPRELPTAPTGPITLIGIPVDAEKGSM